MVMKIRAILIAGVLGLTSAGAMAQWQWIDKDGRRVFSDRAPPPEIPEKNILKRAGMAPKKDPNSVAEPASPASTSPVASAPAAAASSPKDAGVDKELIAKQRQAAEAEAAKRKAQADEALRVRVENCALAKQNKAELDSGGRVSRLNAAGEREVLDDAARAAEARRLQAVIQSECR